MESLTLQPIARVDGTINLPGSKSVSNRALLLAALAHGKTVLTNLLDSDDVRHMLNALTALGVSYTLSADRTRCEIIGNGGPLHAESARELFLGNAGTAMRPLAAALCPGSNDIVLTGEPRMKERPIGHLVDALRRGGAKITYRNKKIIRHCVYRGGFTGGNVDVDGSVSSQFLTALLMTAPLAPEDTVIRIKGDLVSKPYIDITLNLMKTFGVEIENQHYQQFVVKGGSLTSLRALIWLKAMHLRLLISRSSSNQRRHCKSDRHWTQQYAGGDIRFADVLEKWARPFAGAMIIFPARVVN